ncbi:MAG: hypothetical protein JW820_06840 [Spirochaetales bacterium]|nr:hypothetical protein [Spirochaetales bacterium]
MRVVKAPAYLCALILFLLAHSAAADLPAGSPGAGAGGALAIIEEEVRKSPPPLEARRGIPGMTTFSLVLAAGSVGGGLWAVYPGDEDSESGESSDDYWLRGLVWGSLQGFLVNPYVGLGMSVLLYPLPDLRAEYGSLLDVSGPAREERAYLILRRRAEQARKRRVADALLSLGATALPAGTYALGSAFVDQRPQDRDFGVGYLSGILLGSLPWVLLRLAVRSPEERTLASVEAQRGGGLP